MAVISKPSTSDKKHYNASFIKTVSIPPGFDRAVMSASVEGSARGSFSDKAFLLTDKAFHRVKLGGGAKHPELRTGLRSKSRFNLVIMTDGEEAELETAIIQIYPKTGDIDVLAFPYKFYRRNLIMQFIKQIEKTTDFDFDDSLTINNVRFSISQIQGTTITFSCVEQRV